MKLKNKIRLMKLAYGLAWAFEWVCDMLAGLSSALWSKSSTLLCRTKIKLNKLEEEHE